MACHKILIDYSEYVRLKSLEARYDQESHGDGETQTGKGLISPLSLERPLIGQSESITTPANAITDPNTEAANSDENTEKGHPDKEHSSENLHRLQAKKWYFLGIPKESS